MNRADRRRMAQGAPRGSKKAVSMWLKDRCDMCLIGQHQSCAANGDAYCVCECEGQDMRPKGRDDGKKRPGAIRRKLARVIAPRS